MALVRSEAPYMKDAIDFNIQLKPYKKFILDNGVEVYTYEGGSQEVLLVDMVFYAGNCFEQKNWVAAATNFLLKNGTSAKSSFEITEAFEFYGAHLNRTCTNETATVTLHTLSKHFQKVVPILGEIISDANFPEKEIDILKQNQIQRLLLNLKKSDFIASRLIDEYLFGITHPYGKYSVEKDYKDIQREDLIAFYDKYYKNGKCIIFMAGKFPSNIETTLNHYIGALPLNKNDIIEKEHTILSATQKKYSIVNDAESVQGSIRLARNFVNRHHPDFPSAQVLNNIFGGFFGSRLMSNIREDKGYTYGIHSYLQNYKYAGVWMISTDAGKEVCRATIDEVYKEMKKLRENLVEEQELKLVKNYMLGALLGDLDGPFQIISRWKTYILHGLTEDYFNQTINVIKNVGSQKLNDLAKTYLKEEDFYELVVY